MSKKRYTKKFTKTFNWYVKYRNVFIFSGKKLVDKKENKALSDVIQFDINGVNAKEAFHKFESEGKLLPTKHPLLLWKVIKCKASLSFQIKQWAEVRAKGELGSIFLSNKIRDREILKYMSKINTKEFSNIKTIQDEYELPEWVITAIETQKNKFYG